MIGTRIKAGKKYLVFRHQDGERHKQPRWVPGTELSTSERQLVQVRKAGKLFMAAAAGVIAIGTPAEPITVDEFKAAAIQAAADAYSQQSDMGKYRMSYIQPQEVARISDYKNPHGILSWLMVTGSFKDVLVGQTCLRGTAYDTAPQISDNIGNSSQHNPASWKTSNVPGGRKLTIYAANNASAALEFIVPPSRSIKPTNETQMTLRGALQPCIDGPVPIGYQNPPTATSPVPYMKDTDVRGGYVQIGTIDNAPSANGETSFVAPRHPL